MSSWVLVQILILVAALGLDLCLGEPPSIAHPVVWMGKVVTVFERRLYQGGDSAQRLKGGVVAAILIIAVTVPAALFEWLGYRAAGANLLLMLAYVGLSAYLLKASFTIFTLQKEALKVANLAYTDLDSARVQVRALVSRDRSHLDRERILSGVCESVGENTVDSVVAPLLFFALFGIAGALCYRAVNTLDSMLGYKDHRKHAGLCSARLDDVFNYVPTRLAIVPMLLGFHVVSGKAACSKAWNTLKAERHKKAAVNSGIPVALFAGGLGVTLTKPSSYEIGDGGPITGATINRALGVMLIASTFTILLSVLMLFGQALT
ncbi:MAG TPA: adenosylcobinamide-phosphate synthase CbiB [Candidatus Bathyarchaeia archaeon]|nr:adenosylcobinamide-phosphate synthase CbiB [Candidatus Bathyarchaeia archaeon]